LAAASPAFANDSTAELTTGGLVLTRTEHIEMRSEDLFISPKEVRVRYRFLNTAPTDQRVTVAFPMPDITGDIDFMIAVPTEDAQNLLGFRTTVEGRPVAARVEQKAVHGGVDRTAMLSALGVPLAPHLAAAREALDRLPKAEQERLVKLGISQIDEYDAGQGWERHLSPAWTLKTTYYWDQVFPAGREITVEHRYQPSVGASAGTSVGSAWQSPEDRAAYLARYCIDAAFTAAVAKRRGGAETAPFTERRIAYVLKTGANWKKPIGDFRLVIDKERPDSLISFCGQGVQKISPTRFEVRKTNFTPTRDLNILILDLLPAQ
ncbi:MAG: DUF4424 domain-containing protein, partial [Caulobacteraceae bacterium]